MIANENEIIVNKITEYREKLLDMSMRNKLLNFKKTAKSLEIVDENIVELFDLLILKQKRMGFLPRKGSFVQEDNTWHSFDKVKESHTDNYLQTNLEEKTLNRWLLRSLNDNRSMIQEQGFNSLFLALGFVEWIDPKSNNKYSAPLILIPVELERESIETSFKLSWNDDDIRSNLSLQFKLSEQGLDFPLFEELNDREELNEYLSNVNKFLAKQDWRITKDIYLANFNFKKFVMYKDLEFNQWPNLESNNVKNLFFGGETPSLDYDIDYTNNLDSKGSYEVYNVLDADSSQVDVIEEIIKGKDLVVEGPPGTGKSQTIVNLISELLANEKSILFVSEKKAALDVVKSRLDSVGLGDACLEIHGAKYNKRDFLDEMDRTLQLNYEKLKDTSDLDKLDLLKQDLNDYSVEIFKEYGNTGLNAYTIIGSLNVVEKSLNDNNQVIHNYTINNPQLMTKKLRQETVNNLTEIASIYELVAPVKKNFWYGFDIEYIDDSQFDELYSAIDSFDNSLNNLISLKNDIYYITGINSDNNYLIDELDEKITYLNDKIYCDSTEELSNLITNITEYQNEITSINTNSLELNVEEYTTELSTINDQLKDSPNIDNLNIDETNTLLEDIETYNNQYTNLITIKNNIYATTGINKDKNYSCYELNDKINFLNDKTYCDSTEELSNLITNITEYQNKVKYINLNSLDINVNNYSGQLSNIKRIIDDSIVNIYFVENNPDMINRFKQLSDFVNQSPLKNALNDNQLEYKLNLFIEKSNKMFKFMDSEFKTLKNEFNSYYNREVDKEVIINDFNEIISKNNELISVKSQLLVRNELINDSVLYDRCIEIQQTLKRKKEIISELRVIDPSFDINDISRILEQLENIDYIQKIREEVHRKDYFGERYFTNYQSIASDTNELNRQLNEMINLNKQIENNTYTTQTINYLQTNNPTPNELTTQLNNKYNQTKEQYEKITTTLQIKNKINFENIFTEENTEFNKIIKQIYDNKETYLRKKEITTQLHSTDPSFEPNNIPTIINQLSKIKEIQQLQNQIQSNDDNGKKYFKNYQSIKSNTNELTTQLNEMINLNKQIQNNTYTTQTINYLQTNNPTPNELTTQLNNKYNETKELFDIITTTLKIDDKYIFDRIFLESDEKFNVLLTELKENKNSLHTYHQFIELCQEYSNEYTNEIIDLIKQDQIKYDSIVDLFEYNFLNNCINDIKQNNAILRKFNYNIHNNKIEEFKQLDRKSLQLNQYRIKEQLAGKRPNTASSLAMNSPLGMLNKEIGKKRKIKPIRQILGIIQPILKDIKPCLMMSPMSISQYLDSKYFESYFDYVIFDEASQVKVEDSIGALLRGKHYVIMGDTKQLPPTSFFDVSLEKEDEEPDEYDTEGIESILELSKTSFESKMLKWHYRSKHDSLIAFSNMEFYNNNLNVFPSTIKDSHELGIQFEYDPTSVYDRGKSRRNIKEAKNIIDYAMKVFRKYGDKKTVGVGTFSTAQRDAIEDQLEIKLKDNPEMFPFFDQDKKDGFFIKNLENIQGDERDIILISIGYGFDINHKLSPTFGPLNRDGGEKRLNVLITRAKERCVIFANFKSSDLELPEKASRGAHVLKNYLYFAEKKEFPKNYRTGEDFDSPFEESVYNYLDEKGYLIEKQVGIAGYRIDLALVDPDDNDRFLLAIECDGANYHSSRSARDRDRLRQDVLENLGWTFYRIWSWDWFYNQNDSKKRLIEAVEYAIKHKDDEKILEKEEVIFEPELEVKTVEEIKEEQINKYVKDYEYFKAQTPYSNNIQLIRDIILCEQPIHVNDIYSRVKEALGRTSATKKFKNEIDMNLKGVCNIFPIIEDNDFYYYGKYTLKYVRRREKPNIKTISDMELKQSIIISLLLNTCLDEKDLLKTASNLIGYKSMGKIFKERCTPLLKELEVDTITLEKEGYVLKEDIIKKYNE